MNLIFDFDGTICNSNSAMVEILNGMLKIQKPLSVKDLRNKSRGELFKEHQISENTLKTIVITFKVELAKRIDVLKPFPKICAVIQKLSNHHKLFLVTTNSSQNVNKFLINNNLSQHFIEILEGQSHWDKDDQITTLLKKYHLNRNHTFYIGDESRDVQAAKKSGIKSVSVTWGIEGTKFLKQAHPDFLVNKPGELLNIFQI